MKTSYFKVIGQKMGNGKVLVMAVMDEDTIQQDLPSIFELQAMVLPKTIYTGTYPSIKYNLDTLKDVTEEFKGSGAGGIITKADWYNKDVESQDSMGIGI